MVTIPALQPHHATRVPCSVWPASTGCTRGIILYVLVARYCPLAVPKMTTRLYLVKRRLPLHAEPVHLRALGALQMLDRRRLPSTHRQTWAENYGWRPCSELEKQVRV